MSTLRKKTGEKYYAKVEQANPQVQDFQTFYQENLGPIYRYVYSKVSNREEAEDLTSQIFLKAVKNIEAERSALSMQKWLFQVARTTIADHWRVHYRTIATTSLDTLLDEGWEGPTRDSSGDTVASLTNSSTEHAQRILKALPEQYSEVLTCRFLLKLTIRETAETMHLTEANVKVLQFRALKRAAELEEITSETR